MNDFHEMGMEEMKAIMEKIEKERCL